MRKRRSEYSIQFNCNPSIVEQLMQSYLATNQFKVHVKKEEQYFRAGDKMLGYRGLLYSISNQIITIYAWLDGDFRNFSLEQSSMNIMTMEYKNSLNTLFQQISNLNGGNNMNQYNNQTNSINQINNQPIQNDSNQFAQTFQNEITKKQEKMCEIGFWISLFGFFASFFGVLYGLFVYIFCFYFALQGLKTKKRKKAIATIVLSILSIIIIVFQWIA